MGRARDPQPLAEPLLAPRVRVVVVAVALPEAQLVVGQELQAPDPLRPFPEVLLGHDQPKRIAVVRGERLAVVGVGEEDVVVVQHRQRHVGGVALLGVADDVRGVGADLRQLQDRLDRDAFPVGVQLRPAGHAVDVGRHLLARQGLELVPGEAQRAVHLAMDAEVPRRQVHLGHGAVVEDRELLGQVLAGGHAVGHRGVGAAVPEESIEHAGLPRPTGRSWSAPSCSQEPYPRIVTPP